MKIIKVSTELEMSVHEFPEGTMREQNKALYDLIGNGCDIVEHVMPKRLYTELKMPFHHAERVSVSNHKEIHEAEHQEKSSGKTDKNKEKGK